MTNAFAYICDTRFWQKLYWHYVRQVVLSRMHNLGIPHSACKDIWDYLLRLVGLKETSQFPPAEKDFPVR